MVRIENDKLRLLSLRDRCHFVLPACSSPKWTSGTAAASASVIAASASTCQRTNLLCIIIFLE